MQVAVIGGGYVGLVSGTCLASRGHAVTIVERDAGKVAQIESGNSPIHEEGLDELLSATIGKTLFVTQDIREAVANSDLTLIAVGTPFNGDQIDLSQIESASIEIGKVLKDTERYHVVVVKSTVVPGTTDDLVLPAVEQHSGKTCGTDFGVGMNPEFLREGNAVEDFMNPDRIVIGCNDDQSFTAINELYNSFESTDKIRCNTTTAEMIKYAANALLATLISYSNEIGNICEKVPGVDTQDVFDGVQLDKRFSPILENGTRIVPQSNTYLRTGCGFGGSCFPKDVNALRVYANQQGVDSAVLDGVIKTNAKQPDTVVKLLHKHYTSLQDVSITVLGLAFKPGTDDIRESPSLTIVNQLLDAGAKVTVFDPHAMEVAASTALSSHSTITYGESVKASIEGAEAIVVATAWPEFETLPAMINGSAPAPLVIDGRRMFAPDSVARYEGVGRGPSV